MRRTQLYLDEDLWTALHAQARRTGTTVSELVRQAARERYLGGLEERGQAMRSIVGMWKDRPEFADSVGYIRKLRRDDRLARLEKK
ncbi:MAG: ribbon-helix-helix protein, CopG family [Silvibacterium sp.]|nr:ribbon-helix-helix protein, CopG family [Silvibacterium sp.]MBV8436044.1 ribbon-helix-helix protein, CopG family [Silvibacterium sp.]